MDNSGGGTLDASARLHFLRQQGKGITGMVAVVHVLNSSSSKAMLEGAGSGQFVQVSKNWHTSEHNVKFKAYWISFLTMLRVPRGTTVEVRPPLECRV